ncbi:MAG: exopolysaccharide biosynthesis polyprenyl glycosylphosphotransferase [Candidatus Magasanikbacteria bacterium]|jgi:exopolysaccharide biosynthesis polyprenyl glycosylphosphotransferase|nr:exopolysaccharide biosynthesis polyprenyl glycosylphosphotransferase [Candidatus Magasanikbacteria bacterium]MBT4314798.1 exopolysaccharide biosynthesis polyprenyl glycosylphosphotransferase [Candidatus Magasanikbacteria bacterium]MBT4547575.1 exopolysaccharide biosynthesis polyprenyl glycosylphosphotransferase [Candidatus Magasanikbacteria bacterium]MBT6818824.1 exopolysaccharide biosynthesis polyprenyl glycosylphosphotransferase [Candidatus Magasanikbacteria bacterium]
MKIVYRIKQLMLGSGDFLAFVVAFWLSLTIRNWQIPNWERLEAHLSLFFFLFLVWIVVNFINGLYDLGKLKNKEITRHFIEAGLISLVLSFVLSYIIPHKGIEPKTILILNILFGYILSWSWRLIYNKYIGLKRLNSNVMFIGFNEEAKELVDILQNNLETGYKIACLIDPENKVKSVDYPFFDVYHNLKAIRPAVTNHSIDLVVIAPHLNKQKDTLGEVYELLFWGTQIYDMPNFYETITGRITPSVFSEGWFLENLKNKYHPIYEKLKAVVDVIIGIIIGLITILLLPLIALGIKTSSPGPIFYKQKRIGQGGVIFSLYKFRSMYALTDDGGAETGGAQFAIKDDKRVTRVGKFLRKSRLDEIPQFINLLKRDITLIGPRPERPEIVKQLESQMPFYSLRHMVKPGLTGWAVINQHYTDTLEKSLQKIQYDLYYIKNQGFLLDLSILLRTVNVILRMMGQ